MLLQTSTNPGTAVWGGDGTLVSMGTATPTDASTTTIIADAAVQAGDIVMATVQVDDTNTLEGIDTAVAGAGTVTIVTIGASGDVADGLLGYVVFRPDV